MKSMLKKSIVLLSVLMVALALTGCTTKPAAPTATPVVVVTETPVAEVTATPAL